MIRNVAYWTIYTCIFIIRNSIIVCFSSKDILNFITETTKYLLSNIHFSLVCMFFDLNLIWPHKRKKTRHTTTWAIVVVIWYAENNEFSQSMFTNCTINLHCLNYIRVSGHWKSNESERSLFLNPAGS